MISIVLLSAPSFCPFVITCSGVSGRPPAMMDPRGSGGCPSLSLIAIGGGGEIVDPPPPVPRAVVVGGEPEGEAPVVAVAGPVLVRVLLTFTGTSAMLPSGCVTCFHWELLVTIGIIAGLILLTSVTSSLLPALSILYSTCFCGSFGSATYSRC